MISKFKDFRKKIYFAHPKSTYGTDLEEKCIDLIKSNFKECEIINPADYQEDFKNFKLKNKDYMVYFKNLISSCDLLVLLPFKDGKVGFGIIYEIEHIHPDEIYEIDLINNKIISVDIEDVKNRGLNIDETGFRNKNIDKFF